MMNTHETLSREERKKLKLKRQRDELKETLKKVEKWIYFSYHAYARAKERSIRLNKKNVIIGIKKWEVYKDPIGKWRFTIIHKWIYYVISKDLAIVTVFDDSTTWKIKSTGKYDFKRKRRISRVPMKDLKIKGRLNRVPMHKTLSFFRKFYEM